MKIKHFILLAFITLFISNCKTNNKDKKDSVEVVDTVVTSEVSGEQKNDLEVKIIKSDSTSIGSFNLSPIVITSNGAKFTYKDKKGKHKFYANGVMKYEVKFKEKGFKLRDKNSKLLWKIKIYPDKIKISDNEENENPFVLRNRENSVKIIRGEKEISRVKFEGTTIKVNDTIFCKLNKNADKYVYALLGIEEIPDEHKLFILTELLNKI